MKKYVVFVFLGLFGWYSGECQLAPFHAGDRIAFVGNSITEQGYYESYIWLYYMLHFPETRITVLNRGIGGDRAKEMYARWDDDVAPADATVVCLTFGMNDSGYFEFLRSNSDSTARNRVAETRHYFGLLEEKLKALSKVRKVLILGSPYDETAKGYQMYFPGKSKVMEEMTQLQVQSAKANRWGLVDFFNPMTVINIREQKRDSTFTLTGTDRIHPGNSGHLVMAWLFLKAQGVGALPVADISIEGSQVQRSANCSITGLTALPGKEGVRFNYLAKSLPFPVDTVPRLWGNPHRMSEAIGVMPFYETFNREMLRVGGLAAGNYELSMDGQPIGKWSAAELEAGINLAKLTNTPEYEQAMSILQLNEARMGLESKLRAYYWLQFDYFRDIGLKFKDTQAAMDSVNATSVKNGFVNSKRDNYRAGRYPAVRKSWQKEMDLLVDEIYMVNQPKPHQVEVKRLPG